MGGRPNSPEVGTSSSSSGVMTSKDIKALKALRIMKSGYDFDLVVTAECLVTIQERCRVAIPTPPHDRGVSRVVANLAKPDNAQLVALHD
ncbi:hypothetical protein GW17_00059336 [Ensete ventricosum]|nr:hypothetical protein GW17_00059336 [Ensete ventricosum]